jgi:hypothetical protein
MDDRRNVGKLGISTRAGKLGDQIVTVAAETLAASKQHLAPRRPRGDIGQGATPAGESVNLAAIMRARAS